MSKKHQFETSEMMMVKRCGVKDCIDIHDTTSVWNNKCSFSPIVGKYNSCQASQTIYCPIYTKNDNHKFFQNLPAVKRAMRLTSHVTVNHAH